MRRDRPLENVTFDAGPANPELGYLGMKVYKA